MSEDEPKDVSRRRFLKKAAAGAAVAGAAVAAPALLKGALLEGAAGAPPSFDPTKALVAYVRDPTKGEVVVMIGSKEVVRIDPGVSARLYTLAAG